MSLLTKPKETGDTTMNDTTKRPASSRDTAAPWPKTFLIPDPPRVMEGRMLEKNAVKRNPPRERQQD